MTEPTHRPLSTLDHDGGPIALRPAVTDDDRTAVFEFRHRVYVEELMYPLAVPPGTSQLSDAYDETAWIVIAEQNGEVVATGRAVLGGEQPFLAKERLRFGIDRFNSVLDESEMVVCGFFAATEEHRGGVLPLLVMLELFNHATVRHGAMLGLLLSEPHMLSTYFHLGCLPCGDPFEDESFGGTAWVPLALFGDLEHLEAVGSPLPDLLPHPPDPNQATQLSGLVAERMSVRSRIIHGDALDSELRAAMSALAKSASHWSALQAEDFAGLGQHGHLIDWPPHLRLIAGGLTQRTLYLILDGEMRVFDGDRHVGRSVPGDFVGEIGFLGLGARTSDVRAGPAGSKTLAFSSSRLRAFLAEHPGVGSIVYQQLARSLALKVLERVHRPPD